MKTLYERLIEADVATDHNQSDLYFEATEKAVAILKEWVLDRPDLKIHANYFGCAVSKRPWIEVAFAYDPAWLIKK